MLESLDSSVAGSRVGGAGAARARVRIGRMGPQTGLELWPLRLTANRMPFRRSTCVQTASFRLSAHSARIVVAVLCFVHCAGRASAAFVFGVGISAAHLGRDRTALPGALFCVRLRDAVSRLPKETRPLFLP